MHYTNNSKSHYLFFFLIVPPLNTFTLKYVIMLLTLHDFLLV